MPTVKDYRELNEGLTSLLMSSNPLEKEAAVSELNNFVRMLVREDGIQRRYLPFAPVTSADLTPQLVEGNAIVCFKEPRSPGAVTIPYNAEPIGWTISGERFLATFARISTPAFMKDASLLRTYPYDIRQVISDNAVRDIMAQEDSRFFAAVNTVLGTAGNPSPMTGEVQHVNITDNVTRAGIKSALQVLPSLSANLETHTIVVNLVTRKEMLAWTHNEYGGPNSQEVLESGSLKETLFGVNWITTLKKGLVPNNTLYLFADPRAFGVAFMLEDITMYVKAEAWRVLWFCYEEIAAAIGNGSAVARVNFTGTQQ